MKVYRIIFGVNLSLYSVFLNMVILGGLTILMILIPLCSVGNGDATVTTENSTIVVSSVDELTQAISKATAGQIIVLMPGSYGSVTINSQNLDSLQPIKITSFDETNPAVIERLLVNGARNIEFDNLKFDFTSTVSTPDFDMPFIVRESEGITFKNSIFDGDVIKDTSSPMFGLGTGSGLNVSNSKAIAIEGCEFFNFATGLGFSNIHDLIINNNDVHSMRRDGFNFVTINNAIIESNYVHDFATHANTSEHMDMIQFWTTGSTAPSTDIIIRGNYLYTGEGRHTQSIFMRNELVDTGKAGAEMFYKSILIEDNLIYNAHVHGITVGESDGLVVRNNTLLHNSDAADEGSVSLPQINIAAKSTNVAIMNNVIPYAITATYSNWQVTNNLVAQQVDPRLAGYYGDMFLDALSGSKATLADLVLKPGVPEVGSKLTFFDTTPEKYVGYIESSSGTGFALLSQEYVANVYGPNGKIDLSGLPVTWNLPDGSSGTGSYISHQFGQPGRYTITGSVTLNDGTKVPLEKSVIVQSPVALQATFEADTTGYKLARGAVIEAVDGGGSAIDLNGGWVNLGLNEGMIGNDEYTVVFDFKKDAGAEQLGGRAIFFNGSFIITVGANGIFAQLTTSNGDARLEAFGVGIQDSQWHQVALSFSGRDGTATFYVDGEKKAQIGGLLGAVQTGNAQNFAVGDPYNSGFTGLIDNVAFLRGAISAEQAAMLAEGTGQSDPSNIESLWLDASIDPVDDGLLDTDVAVDDTIPSPNEPEVTQTDPVVGPDTTAPGDGTPDTVIAPDFAKTYDGGGGSDRFNGTDRAEQFQGNGGNDTIFALGGDDVVFGGAGGDKLYGGLGNDRVFGDDGRDIVGGGEGDDILDGGADKDRLFGNEGNDILIGGKGADTLYGGAGADLFVFSAKEGVDTVMDFEKGLDRFYIEDALLTYDDLIVTGSRKGVLIKSSDGDFEFKVATKMANIDASDFVFGDPLEDYAVM